VKQEGKINQRRTTSLKAYHTVANHSYSRLKRLTKKSILTAQKEELPLCYTQTLCYWLWKQQGIVTYII